MFNALNSLAKSATLMIVIAAEGEALRVSITPTQAGDKTKAHALRPLVLTATADELDEGFAEAIAAWQAPKRSLLEQVAAARDDDGTEEKRVPLADRPEAQKAKPGRKPKAKTDPDGAAGAPAGPAADGSAGPAADEAHAPENFTLTPPDPASSSPAAPAPATTTPAAPPAMVAAVDDVTLDLF